VLNFDASTSSTRKGETARDTAQPGSDGRARLRHPGMARWRALAEAAGEGTALINAGDGRSAHPTQGLLDMLTLRQAKGPDFSKLSVLIVGDVKHSRVARTDLHALRTLGVGEIRVCGPQSLLPDDGTLKGCVVGDDLDAMLEGVDALMMLRLQRERMEEGLVPSLEQYHALRRPRRHPAGARGKDAASAPGPDQPRRGSHRRGGRRPAVVGAAPGRQRRRRAHGRAGDAAGMRACRRLRPACPRVRGDARDRTPHDAAAVHRRPALPAISSRSWSCRPSLPRSGCQRSARRSGATITFTCTACVVILPECLVADVLAFGAGAVLAAVVAGGVVACCRRRDGR
jgi:hypothetical protein